VRIAVVNLTAGGLSGGYYKYLQRLVPLLRADERLTDLRMYVPEPAGARLEGTMAAPFETWPVGRRGWSARRIARRVDGWRPDVVFVPTARWLPTQAPVAVMVRNMEPLTAPLRGNSAREGVRNLARWLATRHACARATRILAVSGYVRDFLHEHWRIDQMRMSVVPHGVDGERDAPESAPAALARAALPPFLFTAGSLRAARGVEDAIEGLALLARRGLPHHLVIAGEATARNHGYRSRMEALAVAGGVRERVHWVGHLSAPEMRWCFRRCVAFVMTSRMEACPNLVLEAMAHGCASVSTDSAPMPEFFGPAAAYYTAGDATALAERVAALGDAQATEMRAAALPRAARYTWAATADGTLRALEVTLAAARGRRSGPER
jgi:glycosyltransferase involved in cell wall biosynthesis